MRVQIFGGAPNLSGAPDVPGAERWCCNNPRMYRVKWRPALDSWTAWFNLHSQEHILSAYPSSWYLYCGVGRGPVYLRDAPDPKLRTSRVFARAAVQAWAGDAFRYFAFTGAWQLAYAGWLGLYERVELWGFELRRDRQRDHERPCMAYWVARLRSMGIDVFAPPGVDFGPPGDPGAYRGPLYGYETTEPIAPSPGWERWDGRHLPDSLLARRYGAELRA